VRGRIRKNIPNNLKFKGVELKLISLELTNYRKFKSAFIEFPEGVIGILGLNGVGKSTIIEAIAWALYGNETKIVRTKKEDLKRFGTAPNEECLVNLAFDLDGDTYLVSRKMAGKNYQTSANVTVNNKPAATSTRSVTALMENRLGMDYQAFYTSVFAKQKELNAMSILDPSKRKKLILRMLNIDSIEKAIISVRTDKRDIDSRLSEVRSSLYEEDGTPKTETASGQIKEHEMKVNKISEVIKQMEQQKGKMEKELKELEVARTSQRKLRDNFDLLNTKATEIKTGMESTTKQLVKIESELKELLSFEEELKKLEPKIKDWQKLKMRKEELDVLQDKFIHAEGLRKQLKMVQDQKNNYEAKLKVASGELKKLDTIEKDMTECQTGLEKIQNELDEYKKTISESMSKKKQIESDIQKIEERLKDIRELGPDSACPTCERPLQEQFKFLEDKFSTELDELSLDLLKQTKSIEESSLSLDDAKKREEALKKREKHLNTKRTEVAGLQETIKGSEKELLQNKTSEQGLLAELEKYKGMKFDANEHNQVKKKHKELEKVNEKFIKIQQQVSAKPKLEQELKNLKGSQQSLLTEQGKLTEELSDLGFDKTKLEELEGKFDERGNKLKAHLLSLKENENELNLNKKDIAQLKQKIVELKEQEDKAEDYKEKLMYLTKVGSVLDKFKNYMIGRIAPTLTQFASEMFRELTDGRYNRLEVDNDYNVLIYDSGEAFALNRFSGGEEDLANLCLRLAISQIISIQSGTAGPNFVILDEIFGSQDLYRKRNLLQSLNNLTSKFRQIFLITHVEDVKDFIGFNIHVTESDDGSSAVKIFN
jgi:exonuclease SbcC